MDSMGDSYHFSFIFNPRLNVMEFLRGIARGLMVPTPSSNKDELLGEITQTLYRLHEEGRCPVFVIDEAQLVPDRDI